MKPWLSVDIYQRDGKGPRCIFDIDSYAPLPTVRSISLTPISSRSSLYFTPRSCYKIHIHILNSTSISFPPQLTPSLPLSNSFVIHRLAFLLLSAFYSIVFLYFMLNPNHLPLITSFHYSPLWLLLFLLFTFWNRIVVFVIYGFPSLFSCSWNCLLN